MTGPLAESRSGAKSAMPQEGRWAGGSKPWPVSRTVSGKEVVQLCQILCATLGQVVVRLGSNAGGDRRALHEVGIRRVLAAENDYGESRRRGPCPARLPSCDGCRGYERSRGRRRRARAASPSETSKREGLAQR